MRDGEHDEIEKIESYIRQFHHDELHQIIRAGNLDEIPFRGLKIDLTNLKEVDEKLYNKLNRHISIWDERTKYLEALSRAQKAMIAEESTKGDFLIFKKDFPVHFVNLPEKNIPIHRQIWCLDQVEGNVFRTGSKLIKQVLRKFKCKQCKAVQEVVANRFHNLCFEEPKKCGGSCKGSLAQIDSTDEFNEPILEHFIEQQLITIQREDRKNSVVQWLVVELDKELVDSCCVGDTVKICGTFETRSPPTAPDFTTVLRAAGVIVVDNLQHQKIDDNDPEEMKNFVRTEWKKDLMEFDNDELKVRDELVSSIAPELSGLAMVKLGLVLILCSGGKKFHSGSTQASTTTRDNSHILLVGDAGLGKSQLLKAAAKISANSVQTVGYAATTAGLTACCYTSDGDTQIEAGALVKANNGVCCIDELNYMSKEHRGSIHEVMESQKITIAKGGFRMDIATKCSIIAGMNQKNTADYIDSSNLNIEQSLLSRFDLIFALEDQNDPELDLILCNHILNFDDDNVNSSWSLERLRMHVAVAKDLKVEVSAQAFEVLKAYYLHCKNDDDEIEISRRTMRLFEALERLTICHAKLMLRAKAEVIDAVAVVMIMESSWSFGRLLKHRHDVMRSHVPLGPSPEYCAEVLERLNLEFLVDDAVSQQKSLDKSQHVEMEVEEMDIDSMFQDIDDGMSTQEIFSTSAIELSSRRQLPIQTSFLQSSRSFEEFEPPKATTSTQVETPKRKDEQIEVENEKKKQKVDKKSENDVVLMENLKSLAAMFSDDSPVKPQNIKPESPKNVLDKLKKFQYSEEDEQNVEPKKEEAATAEVKKAEKKFVPTNLDDFDCENYDWFGDDSD